MKANGERPITEARQTVPSRTERVGTVLKCITLYLPRKQMDFGDSTTCTAASVHVSFQAAAHQAIKILFLDIVVFLLRVI